jgi:molybdenum cofactor cytidylyltransferase
MADRRQIDLCERCVASRSQVTSGAKIAGVILSGGASRRMGTPKALLRFRDETFLDRLIRVLSAGCAPIIVVVGEHAAPICSGMERAGEVLFAVNPEPERGMLSSLQCGLAEAPSDTDAAMFLPVDHPNIEIETVQMLAKRFERDRAPVTVPTYLGEHGHPVCIARALMEELLALPPEAKASDVIHHHIERTVYVEVSDPAVVTDVDDPAAYAELLARHL